MTDSNKKVDLNSLESYDKLECPECEKICKPVKILKNGTVVYEKHECLKTDSYYFSIDVEGNLVEKN